MMRREEKLILVGAFIVILFGALTNALLKHSLVAGVAAEPQVEVGSWACTADAKICSDGSFVGRIPPYCQFASCLVF